MIRITEKPFTKLEFEKIGGFDIKKVGQVMGSIKKKFGNSADMKMASEIVKRMS